MNSDAAYQSEDSSDVEGGQDHRFLVTVPVELSTLVLHLWVHGTLFGVVAHRLNLSLGERGLVYHVHDGDAQSLPYQQIQSKSTLVCKRNRQTIWEECDPLAQLRKNVPIDGYNGTPQIHPKVASSSSTIIVQEIAGFYLTEKVQ